MVGSSREDCFIPLKRGVDGLPDRAASAADLENRKAYPLHGARLGGVLASQAGQVFGLELERIESQRTANSRRCQFVRCKENSCLSNTRDGKAALQGMKQLSRCCKPKLALIWLIGLIFASGGFCQEPLPDSENRKYIPPPEPGEVFALKLLRETSAVKRSRFKNELRFCRRNQHPRIVKVIDDGITLDGTKRLPFYVMPLYGSTLRKLMDVASHRRRH